VQLVGRELMGLLKERRRRAFRHYISAEETAEAAAAPDGLQTTLVQILALGRQDMLVSVARPRRLPTGGTDLAPWPAGLAPIATDRAPPSRAYQKLEEAFQWMGASPVPGEVCVDLGAAPGGWTLTALRRGARVIAVDRSPVEKPAAGDARLTMTIGNAFTYAPPQPVDWLLCDVVCEPPRTLSLIERWLANGWCRNLVCTVKFKGRAGYGVLSTLPALFAPRTGAGALRFARVKHLAHNKNEVTVMARR
jgi:23S rRNA (cytidine2498-2'-O)-methyltransferase